MPKLLLLCAFLAFCLPVFAQKIPVDLPRYPEQPAAIELQGQNRAVLLFPAPEKGHANLLIREIDSSLTVLRKAEAADVTAGKVKKLSYICGTASDSTVLAYFLADDIDVWGFTLYLSDLKLQSQKVLNFRHGETLLGGFTSGGRCYLLSRWLEHSGQGLLFVHENQKNIALQTHEVSIGGAIRLADEEYEPLLPDPGIELAAGVAANRDKIFVDQDRVFFSSDVAVKGVIQKKPAIELSTLDLRTYTVKTQSLPFPNASGQYTALQKGTHCIFEGKLFALCLSEEWLALQVRDLDSGDTLWQKQFAASDDSLSGLFNSPVLLPTRSSFNIEKEYNTGKKFIPRYFKFDPSIQVRRDSNGYVLCLGGVKEVATGGGGPVFMPGTPGISTPYGNVPGTAGSWRGGWGGGGSTERSANFYVALDGSKPWDRSTRYYEETFYGQINKRYETITLLAEGMFHLFGKDYFGFYLKSDKTYRLNSMKLPVKNKP